MPQWNEFLIKEFQGEASSNRNPQPNQAAEMINFDLREKTGVMITRKAHANLFDANNPIASADHRGKIASMTFLKSTSFIAESSSGAKQEVTIIVTKGDISEEVASSPTPAPLPAFQVFASHQWDGTAWVRKNWDGSTAGWFWLNQVIKAKITGVSTYKITTDITYNATLATKLIGWNLYNVTRNEYSTILKADQSGSYVRLIIGKSDNAWSSSDVIVLSRGYFHYDYFTAMGDSSTGITAEKIQVHSVNNSIRISFGGEEDRLALWVGYKKIFMGLEATGFTCPEMATSDFANYNAKNNLFCESLVYVKDDFNEAITTVLASKYAAGYEPLPKAKYTFRLVGNFDGFNKVLISETEIDIGDNNSLISYNINANPGKILYRLSTIDLYIQKNDELFFYHSTFDFSSTEELKSMQCNISGRFTLSTDNTQLYVTANCLNIDTAVETNDLTDISFDIGSYSAVAASLSNYKLKHILTYTQPNQFTLTISTGALSSRGARYNVSFWVSSSSPSLTIRTTDFNDGSTVITRSFASGDENNFFLCEFLNVRPFVSFQTEIRFTFIVDNYNTVNTYIDNLSIIPFRYQYIRKSNLDLAELKGVEMTAKLGYEPTADLALSWDKAIVSGGKTLLINPCFFEGRQLNRIFYSIFSGAGASQWDIVPFNFLNSFDLETFDGNDLVTADVLPNGNFLALRKNSAQIVDSSTGQAREAFYGKGCVSINSVVNVGEAVIWASQGDIFLSDGLNIINLTEGTIRDTYRDIPDKTGIFATREIKDNAYRFAAINSTGDQIEYLLSQKGWFQFFRQNRETPIELIGYHNSTDGTVIMLPENGGLLKDMNSSLTESESISFSWKSIPFDLALMQGADPSNFFYVNSAVIKCEALNDVSIQLKVYRNGVQFSSRTLILLASEGEQTKIVRIPLGCTAKNIQVGITGSDSQGNSLIVSAVGIMYKVIKGDYLRA